MSLATLIALLIAVPLGAGLLCLLLPVGRLRNAIVITVAAVMAASAVYLTVGVLHTGQPLDIGQNVLPASFEYLITAVDLVIGGLVLYYGLKLRDWRVLALAAAQLVAMGYVGLILRPEQPALLAHIDNLSLILLLISSIIGPIMTIFAIGYMREHEQHHAEGPSRQPRFFALLFLFLATMNALVVADNLLWIYTCWEITTLCSFLLIAHDRTEVAWRNADQALWLNSLGGVAFIIGAIVIYRALGTLSMSTVVLQGPVAGVLTVGVALLCLAAFTKAAQFPFQSWLLGAMVAPTPVSALLHSSTMVKAGVFLVVRLSPLFARTPLGLIVALAGGLTFAAASALAIGQSNGKRVLAYSTIANLGLVIACAGTGTHVAIAAAMLLIIYHALSKGLLFMCIGTVEQRIGSRDIEDMQGVFRLMPMTSTIMVVGMASMLLPPFGVLMTKWLALEATVRMPAVLVLIIFGSAFTVVFWVQWIGNVLTMSHKKQRRIETLASSIRFALLSVGVLVLGVSASIASLYRVLVAPQLGYMHLQDTEQVLGRVSVWLADHGQIIGGFNMVQVSMLALVVFAVLLYFFLGKRPSRFAPPWVGGELANHDIRGIDFIGPGDRMEHIVVHSYYMEGAFSEKKLTLPMSFIASLLIIAMLWVGI